jgi:hypothetical protein
MERHMNDNYRFRDVTPGQGPVNLGNGNRNAGRDYQDNRSEQRIDNRGGRHAGRDYHDRRSQVHNQGGMYAGRDLRYLREGDSYNVQVGPGDPFDAIADGRGVGRAIATLGSIIALVGFAGWAWLIFSFITAIGPEASTTGNPFGKELLPGIPLAPVAFGAFVVGGVIAGIGTSMAKAAKRRYEAKQRYRRRQRF